MSLETSYTEARANLAKLCDRVVNDRETVIITRRGAAKVALIAADELSSLEETAHLLRSPNNATRLITALNRARSGQGAATTVDDLRRDVGLAEEG